MKLPRNSEIGRRAIAVLVAAGCAALAHCGDGGNPIQPPPPPPPNTAPVLRSVTPNRTQVDAGQEVEVTAVAEDAQTPADQLQFVWNAEPTGGTFSGQGRVVRWRAPTDGPVPTDHAIRVTVRDAAQATASGTTMPIRVNDGVREMRQLAETFLGDFIDSNKPAEFCVRNFTNSCPGKQQELVDIQENRDGFTIIASQSSYRITEVHLNSGWLNCTAPAGPASCALVVAPSNFVSRNNHTGRIENAPGTALISGIFEQNQWRLCDSRYDPPATLKIKSLFWQ
jgi:hypothetical protein